MLSGEYSVGRQLSCARDECSDVVAEVACASVQNAKHIQRHVFRTRIHGSVGGPRRDM